MKYMWQALALLIMGALAIQYAMAIIIPLLPWIIGTAVLLATGIYIYRRQRRW